MGHRPHGLGIALAIGWLDEAAVRPAVERPIAVLGVVMVSALSSRLNVQLETISLPPNAVHEIQSNETRLAGMPLRAGVDAAASAAIKTALSQAFVYGFRVIMLVCAGLSMASAGMAWRMIGDQRS